MSDIERRLAALGLALPRPVRPPPGITLPFQFVRVAGARAFISGPAVGAHSRSAVGMAELPFDIPVEVEGEVDIR